MNLFENETVLQSTESNIVILTAHRVRSSFGNRSDASMTSIMLEKISSIQLNSRSNPALIIIGIILIVLGFAIGVYGHSQPAMLIFVLGGIAVIIAYFFTRIHTCIIASDGGARIIFNTSNMKRDALIAFIDSVESAKEARILKLFR